MCHDRLKRMAMLDLMVHGDVDQIVGNRSNTVSRNVVKSITRMMNPMPRIWSSRYRGHEIIRSLDNVYPTHECYQVVAQVDWCRSLIRYVLGSLDGLPESARDLRKSIEIDFCCQNESYLQGHTHWTDRARREYLIWWNRSIRLIDARLFDVESSLFVLTYSLLYDEII